jgi:sporulation protein YlmC with PRC-barrel domain
VINCQVITESGEQLGRVLGFSFDIETGDLTTLVIGALGVPLLGEGVLSTWEMPVEEIVSSGTDRIIVYEGAEEKLKQLGTGLLEKLGIGGGSWEQEERQRLRGGVVPAENQLPAGQPSTQEQRRIQPAESRAFQPQAELEYVELEAAREREPVRQRRYLDEDDDRFRDNRYADERYPDERYAARGGTPRQAEPEPPAYERQRERRPERERFEADLPARDRYDDRDADRYEPDPIGADRPAAAVPPPPAVTRDRRRRPASPGDPIDVEPEILDDPW